MIRRLMMQRMLARRKRKDYSRSCGDWVFRLAGINNWNCDFADDADFADAISGRHEEPDRRSEQSASSAKSAQSMFDCWGSFMAHHSSATHRPTILPGKELRETELVYTAGQTSV